MLDLASTPPGDVLKSMVPKHGDDPLHVRNVTSFIEEVIPIAGSGRRARFAVTGDLKQQPWQFVMDEDGSIEWQKLYRTKAGATGVAWPEYEKIVAAGSWMQGSAEAHPFITSSRLTIPTTTGDMSRCATEPGATFPDQYMYSRTMPPHLDAIVVKAGELYHDEGPTLDPKKGCLDMQG